MAEQESSEAQQTLTKHVHSARGVLLLLAPGAGEDVSIGIKDGSKLVLHVVVELASVVGPVLPPKSPVALHDTIDHVALELQPLELVVVVEIENSPAMRQLTVSLSHRRAQPQTLRHLQSLFLG